MYLNKDGIVTCKRKEEDKILFKYNSIVLLQLYQNELLFRSHDQMGHQSVDKVYSSRIQKRFEWPGLKKDLCMLVVSTGEGLHETKVPSTVNRVIRIQ